jgi:hypothetical protein
MNINMNINVIITILLYLYLIISTIFFNNMFIVRTTLLLTLFLLIKWIFNHRKCTLSYLECKLRNIKKEQTYIHNYCEFFGDLIYNKYNDILFFILLIICIINLMKFIKHLIMIYKSYN